MLMEAARSFLTTRRLSSPRLDRETFEQKQAAALLRWLKNDLPRAPFYRDLPPKLEALPITDKATLMGAFGRFNIRGITLDQAWDAQSGDGRIGDLTVGASTGTSGNRGLFVIDDRERFRWLGTILAKAIPDLLWRRQRVAIVLPQSSGLYDSARRTGWLQLRYFALTDGPEAWRHEFEAFDPTVIVAPPKILRHFAEQAFRISPLRLFSAAETLDPVDRRVIETTYGPGLRQIYMATEGLFAVTCGHGGLHLAEDSVHFEFEPAPGGLVRPLVTCFRRQTQVMARYRMTDLLRLSDHACPCGSPLRVVAEIIGRDDDVFRFQVDGRTLLVTPDVLRNSILKADRRIDDFRLVQTVKGVELHLSPILPEDAADAALRRVRELLTGRGVDTQVSLDRRALTLETGRKLRRVECRLPGA
ncbi:CoF synthetase [Pelagovum pacificum]|uniref:CoF synthetase n=1 Tax=Pelagovum pacificum TaxID=2588711 RepID=A0A5C5GB35_9RHOB|nr:CoF synthetase [Pelagovum pacificum]QQA42094.1 CoF synthetase [Pelagovum pacificum]TNY31182.1 CoF synthetase [Pelagovum pacificum]